MAQKHDQQRLIGRQLRQRFSLVAPDAVDRFGEIKFWHDAVPSSRIVRAARSGIRQNSDRVSVPSPRYSGERVRVRGESRSTRPLTPALSPEYRGEGDLIEALRCVGTRYSPRAMKRADVDPLHAGPSRGFDAEIGVFIHATTGAREI